VRMLCVIDGLGFGGAERSLAELLPGLVSAGIEPTVACLHRRGGGVEHDVLEKGFDIRFLPEGPVARVRNLRRTIRETSPALVQTTLAAATFAGTFAAVGTGVPVLTSLVNQSYTTERMADPHVRAAAVHMIRAIDGVTSRHLTTHFHAITQAVKRWAVATLRVPPDRITVVERGRDPRRLGVPGPERRAIERQRLGLEPDAKVVVAVGRQEFQKGHRFLLEAMIEVIAAHPSAVLLLAGREGEETTHLRTLAEHPPLDRAVRFMGHRDDLPDILAASDVFAFPSLWEGLGGAVIESMALGLPIVATDLEPVREVVEDGRCALLVPPRAPRAIASAISSLFADRDQAQALGSTGREIFLRRFTLQRSTERMIALCRQVADSRPGARALGEGLEVS
jgi:glycosyltransferase involved in cell wall biosynthesis